MLNLRLFIDSYSFTECLYDVMLIAFYIKLYGGENIIFYVELKLNEPVLKCVV